MIDFMSTFMHIGVENCYITFTNLIRIAKNQHLSSCSCWLPSDKGMIFAFVGPMIAIIVVRASLYQLVLCNTAQHPSSTHHYILCKSYKHVLSCTSIWLWFIGALQLNATLLAVSLVSLAKSQCGKVGGNKDEKQTEEYVEVGKWVSVGKMHWVPSFYTPMAI